MPQELPKFAKGSPWRGKKSNINFFLQEVVPLSIIVLIANSPINVPGIAPEEQNVGSKLNVKMFSIL
jgi:hypothetical protein